jgi:hypothetical protein
MLETGQIQVSIEWIPVGAEISINIDFMVLSAISHLSLKIPLQSIFHLTHLLLFILFFYS